MTFTEQVYKNREKERFRMSDASMKQKLLVERARECLLSSIIDIIRVFITNECGGCFFFQLRQMFERKKKISY